MFSKKRIKRILKNKNKLYTKKKIKKNKKYKKHNSFRKKKNNLRIQTIKKNKKHYRNQKNKKHYRKKFAKKRKAYIHKGGKKLKISNIFISNKNNIDSLNKFITIKTDEQNIQFGGTQTDNTSQQSILEKYFPVNFLKDEDKLIIKLLKDDDIQKTTQSESNITQEQSDEKEQTKRAEAKKVKAQLPSSCNTSKFTHGTSGMWIVAPPSSECSNLEVKQKLKKLLGIEYKPDVLLPVS